MDCQKTLLPVRNRVKCNGEILYFNDIVSMETHANYSCHWADDRERTTDYAVVNNCRSMSVLKGINEHICDLMLMNTIFVNRFYLTEMISFGELVDCRLNSRNKGISPVINFNMDNFIKMFHNDKIKINKEKTGSLFLHTIELGEYPNSFVGNELDNKLEQLYNKKNLLPTGKIWNGYMNSDGSYQQNCEYVYNNKKFVRAKLYDGVIPQYYKNDDIIDNDKEYQWFNVDPIEWVIQDWPKVYKAIKFGEKNKINSVRLKTKECLISGVPFYNNAYPETKIDWGNSDVRKFLNNNFLNQAFYNIDKEDVNETEEELNLAR